MVTASTDSGECARGNVPQAIKRRRQLIRQHRDPLLRRLHTFQNMAKITTKHNPYTIVVET